MITALRNGLEWAVIALIGAFLGAWLESVRIEQQCERFGAFKRGDLIYRCAEPVDTRVNLSENGTSLGGLNMYTFKSVDEGSKYLAQLTPQGDVNQGCYKHESDSLDSIRDWAKRIGKAGDVLLISRNGAAHLNKTITL